MKEVRRYQEAQFNNDILHVLKLVGGKDHSFHWILVNTWPNENTTLLLYKYYVFWNFLALYLSFIAMSARCRLTEEVSDESESRCRCRGPHDLMVLQPK